MSTDPAYAPGLAAPSPAPSPSRRERDEIFFPLAPLSVSKGGEGQGEGAPPPETISRRIRAKGIAAGLSHRLRWGCLGLCVVLGSACQQEMADQPRYKPLAKSSFFGDGRSARPLVEGTVARGQLQADEHFFFGKSGGALVRTLPFPISLEVLQRGRERYDIFCSVYHGRLGNGDGMVVRRGFRPPPSFHIDRLRQAPVGHFFDVISNGFGAMPDYAQQISAKDRWAIVAYVRALQLSQNARVEDVPAGVRQGLPGREE